MNRSQGWTRCFSPSKGLKCAVTTSWDDGHRLDLKLSEMLLRHGIAGTFFIAPKYLRNGITAADIKILSGDFEIGAHTVHHCLLTEIPVEQANLEIKESKEELEGLVDHEIQGFCYPKGAFNDKIIDLVKAAGFTYARTIRSSMCRVFDPYKMGVNARAHPSQLGFILRTTAKSMGASIGTAVAAVKISVAHRSSLWEAHSKLMFEYVLRKGGVWHLWGHSWEINHFDMWNQLDDLLGYVSNRKDVAYLTNREVVECMHTPGS